MCVQLWDNFLFSVNGIFWGHSYYDKTNIPMCKCKIPLKLNIYTKSQVLLGRGKGEMSFPTKPVRIMQPRTKPLQYEQLSKLSLFKKYTQKLLARVWGFLKQEGIRNHLLWPLWEPTGTVSVPVPKTQALGLASLSDQSNCWICLLRKQWLSAKNGLATLYLWYGHSVHWVTTHLRQLNLSIIKQSPTDSLSILSGDISARTHTKSTDKQATPQKQ